MSSMPLQERIRRPWRIAFRIILLIAGSIIVGALVWQGITASGAPDPTAAHLDHNAVIMSTALLVFREGLEAILVLAAITASLVGTNQSYRKPIAAGVGVGLIATIATWFVAIAVIGAVNAPALDVQAGTGLLAIVVLLVIMNWFFHKIYWTGWISMHNKRRKELMQSAKSGQNHAKTTFGFAMLGLTAIYREGFEIVLFLQNLRLQVGSNTVLVGVAIGLAFTSVVAVLTFIAHHKLPYKKMLILTGAMLAMVLVVMVGESAQELQLAHWIPTTTINLPIPAWAGIWFAVFPTVESLTAQIIAGVLVLGSYFTSQYIQIWRPRLQEQRRQAQLAANAPVTPAVTDDNTAPVHHTVEARHTTIN